MAQVGMTKSDEELVVLYSDLVRMTNDEIKAANQRLAQHAFKLYEAAERVAQKSK